MAEIAGRKLLIQRDIIGVPTTIASVRSKSVSISNEPIDITTDDSDGWRTLLAEPGNRTVDISVSGVMVDDELRALILAATDSVVLESISIVYPDGGSIEGSFYLNSYSETGEYQDAVTFEASLQSSGPITYSTGE